MVGASAQLSLRCTCHRRAQLHAEWMFRSSNHRSESQRPRMAHGKPKKLAVNPPAKQTTWQCWHQAALGMPLASNTTSNQSTIWLRPTNASQG